MSLQVVSLALTTAAFVIVLIAMLFSKTKLLFHGKHCYIGGASEGLGLSLAKELVRRGASVSLVSRSVGKLEKAKLEVEKERIDAGQKVNIFACDLLNSDQAAKTLQVASGELGTPDYIFACAGGCIPGYFIDTSVDKQVELLEWNFKSCLNTIHAGIKSMVATHKKGSVVLVSSVLAMMSFAGYGTYSPGKYAIRGLADSLRNELLPYGISVHLFMPATMFSPGFLTTETDNKPPLTKEIEGPDEGVTCDQAAQYLLDGLKNNNYYITYEFVGHALRTSRGTAPWNGVTDLFWGTIGAVGMPLWRKFVMDRLARNYNYTKST